MLRGYDNLRRIGSVKHLKYTYTFLPEFEAVYAFSSGSVFRTSYLEKDGQLWD